VEPLVKATLRETREHNERLVLATIYDDGPVSRAEIARLTGLTRTTVSDVVEGLIASGLTREIGRGPSTGGKAPILLEVPDVARLLVGVDLGDRVFSAATVNLRGEILQRIEVPSEDADGDRAVALALELIERILTMADGPVLGVGIGAPGLVDTASGTVIRAVMRDWRQLALGKIVSDRFALPVRIANDSQAGALAEYVFGATRGRNLVVVKVGEGIGAGLVLNGSLFEGDRFGAGEIGHTVVNPDGDPCRCERRGCLETVASTRAVLAALEPVLGGPVSLERAVAAFERGDERVVAAVREAGEQLGIALAGLIGTLHVRRLILAGTMASFGDRWLGAVRDAAVRRCLPALAEDTTFELGPIDDIIILGASALLMTSELGLRLQPIRRPRSRPADPPAVLQAGQVPPLFVASWPPSSQIIRSSEYQFCPAT
jgi:predicted NBD/HSP70 family sugar kinase